MADYIIGAITFIVVVSIFIAIAWLMKDTDKFGWIWDGFTTKKEDLKVKWKTFEEAQK